MKFEIFFPSTDGSKELIVREEGANWFSALENALKGGGMGHLINNILCDIKEDGSIHVTETINGKKFLIREFDPNRVAGHEKEIGRTLKKRDPNEVLATVFEEVLDGFDKPEQEGLDFFLDLAMKHIPADSGSIAIAPLAARELTFVACRGPKSDGVKGLKIPMGTGIAGFSALNNVLIAVSDVQKDPRFFKDISEKLGYPTKSIVASPILYNNLTFGMMELINKKESSAFDEDDIHILRFVSEKLGEYLNMIWEARNNNLEDE
ncbi:MAG TPA: GAF domain-containing protein [bacterium]|nr:GAF domain-containing protein [bacterium]